MEEALPFIFVLSLVALVFNFAKWKTKHNTERMALKQGEENSMSSAELQDMIADAVASSNIDLRAEIADLKAEKSNRLTEGHLDNDFYETPGQINAPRQRN